MAGALGHKNAPGDEDEGSRRVPQRRHREPVPARRRYPGFPERLANDRDAGTMTPARHSYDRLLGQQACQGARRAQNRKRGRKRAGRVTMTSVLVAMPECWGAGSSMHPVRTGPCTPSKNLGFEGYNERRARMLKHANSTAATPSSWAGPLRPLARPTDCADEEPSLEPAARPQPPPLWISLARQRRARSRCRGQMKRLASLW